jgi:hypothetical protein
MAVDFHDLMTTGFVVVPKFLGEADLAALRQDFANSPTRARFGFPLINVDDPIVERFSRHLRGISEAIAAATDLRVDIPSFGSYVHIESGKAEGWQNWHQDTISYYLGQDNYQYVNTYIAVTKPDASRTNVRMAPFDAMEAWMSPELRERVRGGGARRALRAQEHTWLLDDQEGGCDRLDGDLATLAVTPSLAEGDLLLMRGDVFHTTQDVDTDRLAVSFRLASSRSVVTRRRLGEFCLSKLIGMTSGGAVTLLYQSSFDAFARADRDALTAAEFNPLHARIFREATEDPSTDRLMQTIAEAMASDNALFQTNLERMQSDVIYLLANTDQDETWDEVRQGLMDVAGFLKSRDRAVLCKGLWRLTKASQLIARLLPELPPQAPRQLSTVPG